MFSHGYAALTLALRPCFFLDQMFQRWGSHFERTFGWVEGEQLVLPFELSGRYLYQNWDCRAALMFFSEIQTDESDITVLPPHLEITHRFSRHFKSHRIPLRCLSTQNSVRVRTHVVAKETFLKLTLSAGGASSCSLSKALAVPGCWRSPQFKC